MPEGDIKYLIRSTIERLLSYCQQNNWSGYDPFDGLESRIFRKIPFFQNRICRLAFIQAMKRFPINFRPLFLVPKGQNPKGLALFASALIRLADAGLLPDPDAVPSVLKRLIELRTPNAEFSCWGYNFDWQSRAFFLPKFTPNIICTTFAGNALLDGYKKNGNAEYLEMAVSAGDFLLNGLNKTGAGDEICFSYTPLDRGQVHNANLLGAAFLSRLYHLTQAERFIEPARRAVRFSVRRQREDGSWAYGEDKTQGWIDNFHTGYNLGALKKFSDFAQTDEDEYDENIRKGFEFYIREFFEGTGIPKYFHNRLYPIDIHAVAQSIITLVEFRHLNSKALDLAVAVFKWALGNMQSRSGYFYYQKKKFYKNRIPYMRWSQAWMLYGLAVLAEEMVSS